MLWLFICSNWVLYPYCDKEGKDKQGKDKEGNVLDINDLRGFSTVLVFLAFVGICWWAFSPKRKKRFTDAANLPFADENLHEHSQIERKGHATANNSIDSTDTIAEEKLKQ